MKQPGRPPMYAATDPRVGLEKMMVELEREMLRQLEEKRKTAERASSSLSKLHDKSREASIDRRVWGTRRDSAFIARYCEAIRNTEKEFVIATPAIDPPEKEVLEVVRHVLKKNRSVRVVRQITPQWTRDESDGYEELIRFSDQVRCLKYDGLRFAVFDKKDTVLVLPPEKGSQVAVWINLPSLATILYEYFEALWKKGQPALPILRKLKEAEA